MNCRQSWDTFFTRDACWGVTRFKVLLLSYYDRPKIKGTATKTRQIKGNLAGVDVGMSHLMSKQLHNYRGVPKWEPLAETAEVKKKNT